MYKKNHPTQVLPPPLKISEIIGVLGDDFSNIYCVDRESQQIEIYRYENAAVGVKEVLHEESPYQLAVQHYIEANVLQEDKEKMKIAIAFDNVCSQLKLSSQFTVHYRVKRNNEILFYRMKCARIGDPDTFQKIIFAFASEDRDVRLNELGMMKSSGATGKRKILIATDDRQHRNLLYSLLGDKYAITTARNGDVGLHLLEAHYTEFSLVLMDVHTSDRNGLEFLKKVREDALLSLVPVIVIAEHATSDDELDCLELGASDFISLPCHPDILRQRIRNVVRLKESSLTLQAVEHDELTGLYTTQAFFHYVNQIIRFQPNNNMHLIVAKIKDFKLINSIYGTKKADQLLCYLASCYGHNLKDGLLARKDGSFTCLLYGNAPFDFPRLIDDLHKIVEHAPIPGVKVKCGIYQNIDKTLPIATLCDYASMACDTILENYDRDVAYYTEELAQARIREQLIENSFDAALNDQEFVVYYQPKIDLLTETVVGAEALVRWKRPDGTMVSPGVFIPVYEKDGLIEKLDLSVFRQVCQFQKRQLQEAAVPLPISVNLSRSSILHSGIAQQYIQIAVESGIPLSCVPLELTESSAIYGDRIRKTITQLLDAGFELHMDDFGSGYSSLSCLNQIPFHALKIDKSLIDHVCTRNGRTLVEQVILLAKLLNMKVVAEGAETLEQIDELRTMRCDEIQGFYYAKPMPEAGFLEYVRLHRA